MSRADRMARRWARVAGGGRVLLAVGGGRRVERAVLEAMERGDIRGRRGEVLDVEIRHDDWCPALVISDGRRGRCRCEPDVVPHARGAA
jgi:hypothetical protein